MLFTGDPSGSNCVAGEGH